MNQQERNKFIKDILEKNGLELCRYNMEQVDRLSDLDLISIHGSDKIVKELKRYEAWCDKSKMKYPEKIMCDVRQNLGLDRVDTSKDIEIYKMDRKDILNAVCKSNGLGNCGYSIIQWIEYIYQVKLKDEI